MASYYDKQRGKREGIASQILELLDSIQGNSTLISEIKSLLLKMI